MTTVASLNSHLLNKHLEVTKPFTKFVLGQYYISGVGKCIQIVEQISRTKSGFDADKQMFSETDIIFKDNFGNTYTDGRNHDNDVEIWLVGQFDENPTHLDNVPVTIIQYLESVRVNINHLQTLHNQDISFIKHHSTEMTFEEMRVWGEQTFGDVTPSRIVKRTREEFDELELELEGKTEWTPKAIEEAADIVIILTRAPGLGQAVQDKMQVNLKREWHIVGDGTGYHKPADSEITDNPTAPEPN